jgi:hypothetical protein
MDLQPSRPLGQRSVWPRDPESLRGRGHPEAEDGGSGGRSPDSQSWSAPGRFALRFIGVTLCVRVSDTLVRAVELERAAERARTGRRVLADARCSRSRGGSSRRAWSPGGTSGLGWRRETSGRGSRRCCAIARSSSSTPLPAIDGETAFLPCSRPGTYWLQRFASVPVGET